jgi:hypothetical protein
MLRIVVLHSLKWSSYLLEAAADCAPQRQFLGPRFLASAAMRSAVASYLFFKLDAIHRFLILSSSSKSINEVKP